jgi:hypothetical protein
MSGTGALAVACSALISASGAEPSSKAANDVVTLMKARHLDAVAIETRGRLNDSSRQC